MTLELPTNATDLLRNLSPSKVETGTEKCMLRLKYDLEFRRDKIPVPTSYFMLAGTAVHEVVDWALTEVKYGRKLPSAQDCHDKFPASWDKAIKEATRKSEPIEVDDDDPPEKIKRESHALVPFARDKVLVKLNPILTEHDFKPELDVDGEPITVWGRIDEMEKDGQILDWKTTGKVSQNARKLGMQVKAYGWWDGLENRTPVSRVSKVFFIRGRKPSVDHQDYMVTPAHRESFVQAAIQVTRAARAGAFPPNTGTFWCSEKWCPFWTRGCPHGGGSW